MPEPSDRSANPPRGFLVSIVSLFLRGPLSVLFLAAALLLGLMAIHATPREEEPQIVVPMADVLVDAPGFSAGETERLVATPLEKLLWQIDGVEHVYSISRRGSALVTVRFFVGRDRDRAMVKLRDTIDANRDIVPEGVRGWTVKPVEIDDVPIVTLTLHSPRRDGYELRRLAAELEARLAPIPDLFRTSLVGGYRRQIRIEPRADLLASRGLCFADLRSALARNNAFGAAGALHREGQRLSILAGGRIESAEEARQTVVRESAAGLVRLGEVAAVTDGPEEPEHYVRIGFGPGAGAPEAQRARRDEAVTLAFSKKKGTNAVAVAAAILAEAERLRASVLPDDVEMRVTRNYGRTADEKVNGLLAGMFFAILTVVGLMAMTMGWREALVVGLSVPVSFALALFVNYAAGFTINRVTLFALILSLGLVVDDPITNVDNIQRHLRLRLLPPVSATLAAVQEVLPPVILSTLAIIVSFTPLFFITGMMGPYMGPMAVNVPLTVSFSTLSALTFVPWLAYRLLRGRAEAARLDPGAPAPDPTPAWVRRLYRRALEPFLSPKGSFLLGGAVVLLLLASAGLVLLRLVPLKMLPFDNKDELQIVLDLPEGSSLEMTDRAAREIEEAMTRVNEVADFTSYVGLPSPIDFNGLVRHYNLRREPHLADIRVNLLPKARRKAQSHAIALRLRDGLAEIGRRHDALVRLVETPPGPPVLSTLTVELYGEPGTSHETLLTGAEALMARLAAEDSRHIVEIDAMAEAPHDCLVFAPDREKAAFHSLARAEILDALSAGVAGQTAGLAAIPHEREPVPLLLRLGREGRESTERLGELSLRNPTGTLVPLGELGRFRREREEQPIYHKDLERVVFVTAECAGRPPGGVIVDLWDRLEREPLPEGIRAEWAGEGEWQITVRVFRDLGIAFGVAMIGIYLLMTVQMGSFFMPLLIMSAIPLTVIGIAPGFALLNLVAGGSVGGRADPVFFTATGMIGMIALGGIVIRNSVVLIEFIQDAQQKGRDLRSAILESGAVRFRPIVLTAATTMLGAWPITLDPIFSGLAWALIFGLFASTLFTLLLVPVLYLWIGPRRAPAPLAEEAQ